MTEIQSLTLRVQELSQKVDFWNLIMLWGLAVAAIAAVVVGISTRLVVLRSGQLSEVHDQLISAKERQLKIDLKEKDRQIALATQGAATATEQSDKAELAASKAQQNLAGANERAADAEERAATAQLGAENAKKSAADAMIGQQRVEIELDKQRERAAIAERRLLELQQTLADRSLTDLQLKRIADKLRFSGGQEYEVIAYWDSPESVGIANRISQALQLAQWKLVTPKAWKGLMGGMVGVKVSLHPEADEQTRIAADNLVTALNAEGIQSSKELQNPTNNPSNNMISLSVGSKR